jgi:hypothetical protein
MGVQCDPLTAPLEIETRADQLTERVQPAVVGRLALSASRKPV